MVSSRVLRLGLSGMISQDFIGFKMFGTSCKQDPYLQSGQQSKASSDRNSQLRKKERLISENGFMLKIGINTSYAG